MSSKEHIPDQPISPAQLRVGLYVHVDQPWLDHPFTFSSFKIRNLEQIATLQAMGLTTIRYSPAKSDAEPLPEPAEPAQVTGADLPSTLAKSDPVYQAKRERIQRLVEQRERIAECERQFVSSSKAIRSINQNVFARPDEARAEANTLINAMADSMMTDVDVAINLMKEKLRGEEVYSHALNVTLMAMTVAKEMKAPPETVRAIGVGAMFHDLGKIEIPDRIVKKRESLTKAEAALFELHCSKGVDLAGRLKLPPEAVAIILQHHEHVDGTGYPKGLKGAQIALPAKIVAIVNAYENLCNPNDPAKALTPHEALSTLYAQQRDHFEPIPLNTFVRCLGIYPPGTLVVLSNDSLGIVVSVNATRPLKPSVMVYDPHVPKEEAIVVDLEEESDIAVSRALRPQQLTQPVLEYLSPRKRLSYYFDTSGTKSQAS